MSILYIGFIGWRRQLRRSFYRPLSGGIPLPPLTWSHSSWQAGKSSYRSAVPYPPRWKACHRHEKRADSFRSFSLPSISRSGAVVIIPAALPVSAGIRRSRSLCRSCRHGSPGSRSALGPGTSHSSCCHCYRQIHCSRQEKSGQQQPGK